MLARHELDEESQRLLAAADYLEQHGHCKHILYDDKGRVCALGAIMCATGQGISGINGRALERVGRDLSSLFGYYDSAVNRVVEWNNALERTGPEVVAKFREVAYDPQYAKVAV